MKTFLEISRGFAAAKEVKPFSSVEPMSSQFRAVFEPMSSQSREMTVHPTSVPRIFMRIATLVLLLTLSVGQMWGADVQQNAIIYMDNSAAGWDYSNIYFVINNTNGYPMSAVEHTKLYVHKRSAGTWSGYSNVRFFAATASWGGDDASMGSESNMASYGANLTNTQTNYGFNGNNYYAIKLNKKGAKESGSRANLSTSYIGNAISSMNKTMTIKAKISTDGGSSYSAGNTPGKLTAASFKFTTYNSCSSATSATVNAGSASSTLSVGYTADLTLTAVDVDGYDFIGWSSGTNASTNVGTTKTVTVNPTGATTYYAWYREKRHQIKALTPSPSAGGSSNSPSSWTYAGEITGGSISVSTNTGYDFTGWTISSGSGTFANASATSTTFYPTADSELRPNFTTKTITVTLDGNEGTGGTATVKYNASSLTSITHASRAGYSLNGYYTEASGGSKVINADGSLNNVSGWVSGGYWKQTDETQVLYAQWTEDETYYNLKFGTRSGEGSYGTVAAINATTSASLTTNTNYLSGTSVRVTATPDDDYKFVSWYNAATGGSEVTTDNPYTFTLNAATSVYAHFVLKTTSITLERNGGSGGTTSKTINHGASMTGLTAPGRSGYTFTGWWTEASGGTKVIDSDGTLVASVSGYTTSGKKWDYDDPTLTLYAQWTEKTSTLTTSNHYDSGDPSYAAPTKSASSIGISTTATVTASSAGTGYTFAGWTLTNCVRTDGGGATANPITVRSNGDGAAATVVANYEEVLTSTYYVEGDASGPFTYGWNANANTMMMKRSGLANTSDVYWTLDVPAAKTSPGDAQWEFKIYNSAGANDNARYMGWGTGDNHYWLTKANHSLTLSTSGSNNIRFKPYVEGTYTFHVNYSTPSSPTLEVIWPVVNQLRISAASPTDATNTNNFDLSDQGSNNWAVTRTLNANTTYTFKMVYDGEWYGKNSTNLTRASSSASTLSTSGADMTIKTDVAGDYTFTFNSSSKNLSVTYPTAHTVTFGSDGHGTVTASATSVGGAFSSDAYIAHNDVVTFSQTPNTGYTFKGWYTTADGSTSAGVNGSNELTISADKAVYAQYNAKSYVVTLDVEEAHKGTTAGATTRQDVTFDAATTTVPNLPTAENGYGLFGYYTGQNGEGTKLINGDGTWIASVDGYTDGSKNWIHDGDVTLYAYYKKAEITSITFSPASAEPDDEVTATAVISPTPTGSTMVCWEVRYKSNNVLLDPQPTFTPASGASVTFTAPAAAIYKVTATLKTGNDCGAGTVLDTEDADLTVAGNHAVTIRYKHGDVVIKEETVENIHAVNSTPLSAPDIIGYAFSSWTLGDGISLASGTTSSSSISVTAIYDGVITINYNPKRMIYFYNTLGWSSVNVYFYKNDSYWNNTNGTGANTGYTFTNTPYSEGKHGAMTNITGTNIWYFDAEGAGVNASYEDVVFTELDQHGYGYFAKTDDKQNKVVRRGDYKSSMPMFVPVEQDGVSMNGGLAVYYNHGYWMNYPENTGYTVRIYNAWNVDKASPAREYYFPYSADKKMPLKLDVEFNTTDAKWFMIHRNDGEYLSVNAEMTQASHTNYRISSSNDKIKIQPSAPGVYTYTLTYYDDGEKDGGGRAYGNMYHISVDYPVSVGDYRILYKDNATWSQGTAHTPSWNHPSDAINKISGEATEAKKDTVSLFVSYGASPTAKFQYVSAINPSTGAVTWADVDGGTISLSSITKSGTYNFIVTQPVGGASVSVEKIEAYTGNYYIRTDCAGNTKWDNYRAADHQMTYSEFSCSEANSFGEKFSHYFTHWCPAGMNVKFVIANDYSACISDTLIQDVGNPYANINESGFLNSDSNPDETANRFSANIRFMYNEATNKISRAYVASSTNNARWFLVLRSNTVIKDQGGDATEDIGIGIPSVILDDKQNWIYEKTLKIKPGSKFKLFACYAEVTPTEEKAQYFRGHYA
ncbi:MAG: InlB B-repeat-containing protein, partial [Paludibacteraceae bacterium]|nr:InlB B-repeat-containing protein [Paludibacteraceae bacterium]